MIVGDEKKEAHRPQIGMKPRVIPAILATKT